MNQNKISDAQELLKKAYSTLPSEFSLREVRAYIYNALQKLALFETKQAKKQEQKVKQQEQEELKRKLAINLPWQMNDAQKAISIIDKMIAEEESKINVYKQQQVNAFPLSSLPPKNDEGPQTLHG